MRILVIAPVDLRLREGTSARVINMIKHSSGYVEHIYLASKGLSGELSIPNLTFLKISYVRPLFLIPMSYVYTALKSYSSSLFAGMIIKSIRGVLKNVDIIHVHTLAGLPLVPKNDVPILLDLHGLFELTPVAASFSLRDKLVVELLRIIEKVVLMNLNSYGDQIYIIAQSPYIKKYIIKRFGIPEHRVFVVPDGIDLSLVPIFNETRRLKIREKLNLIDRYVMAYAGTPSYYHGFHDLLRAFKYVHQVYEKSHLLLMVPNKNIVINQLRKYDVDLSYVTVLENIRKPWYYEILYASDVLILPHRGNTQFDFIYSNKLLDYIVTGRVIVGYDLMPVRDMLARYPLKILAKPNDPKALAEAILEGRAFRDSYVDGKQYIRGYEWSILAKEIVNIYKYLLENQGKII